MIEWKIDSTVREVLDPLLEQVKLDPYPDDHTSSYWKKYGPELIVARDGDRLSLDGFWMGRHASRVWALPSAVERFSYRRVTKQFAAYPEIWSLARRLASDLAIYPTYNFWRLTMALCVLADHWNAHQLSPKTFAMIGDGSGFLGALIRRYVPQARVYSIDLPKGLVFQAYTGQRADPRASLGFVGDRGTRIADLTFVLPWHIEEIRDTIDCAVNIASMNEMLPDSIDAYFAFLRRRSGPQSRFYCANRSEKILPGGEVVRFHDYPWQKEDHVFLDEPCPYFSHFLTLRKTERGPTLFGRRIPFLGYFDGAFLHRLVHLAPAP